MVGGGGGGSRKDLFSLISAQGDREQNKVRSTTPVTNLPRKASVFFVATVPKSLNCSTSAQLNREERRENLKYLWEGSTSKFSVIEFSDFFSRVGP